MHFLNDRLSIPFRDMLAHIGTPKYLKVNEAASHPKIQAQLATSLSKTLNDQLFGIEKPWKKEFLPEDFMTTLGFLLVCSSCNFFK